MPRTREDFSFACGSFSSFGARGEVLQAALHDVAGAAEATTCHVDLLAVVAAIMDAAHQVVTTLTLHDIVQNPLLAYICHIYECKTCARECSAFRYNTFEASSLNLHVESHVFGFQYVSMIASESQVLCCMHVMRTKRGPSWDFFVAACDPCDVTHR